jgi:ABC-2 type transport system permease protein
MINKLAIIFSISAKDIQDAIKNRFVYSQIIAVTIILISIKGLGLIIEPQDTPLIIYDPAGSTFSKLIAESEDFSGSQVKTLEDLQTAISSMGFGLGAELGLEIPRGFDTLVDGSQPLVVEGYVSWANRNQAERIKAQVEGELQELFGRLFVINLEGNIITPPREVGLLVGIVTIFAVTIILTIGINLVPTLMIEEKQNRTLDALLLSPASIWQVVAGKAIAGAFYVLVTTLIVYLAYWSGVYSWGITLFFVIGAVLFAVSVGLLLGIIFNRPQEMTGWLSLILVLITGSIFIELINLDLPPLIEQILPWLPPVALAKIFWASFSSQVDIQQVLASFGAVALFSGALFVIIYWRIRQIDR